MLEKFEGMIALLNPGETMEIREGTPASVVFCVDGKDVLTLTKDGIYADKSVRVGDAAKAVFKALEPYWKQLQQAEILAEREACAQIADRKMAEVVKFSPSGVMAKLIAGAIRART